MAIGALRGAAQMDWDVPVDISVIGFDDMAIDAFVVPSLTTVRQPVGEIGQRAIELLLDAIARDERAADGPNIVTQPELVIRESTAPPPSP
jgi:DNA-binding LacI/PurR family transcriptional regulator